MLNQPTIEKLNTMKLYGMADAFRAQLESTDMSQLAFEERFGMLVDQQWLWKENRALAHRLRAARLKERGVLEDIDYQHPRGADPRRGRFFHPQICRVLYDCLVETADAPRRGEDLARAFGSMLDETGDSAIPFLDWLAQVNTQGLDNSGTSFQLTVLVCGRPLTECCWPFRAWLIRLGAALARQFGFSHISIPETSFPYRREVGSAPGELLAPRTITYGIHFSGTTGSRAWQLRADDSSALCGRRAHSVRSLAEA